MRRFSTISSAVMFFLALCASSARADVVILKGNDVPLTGRIIGETEDSLKFVIKGLGSRSEILIEKSRVKSFWREENSYWEFMQAEKERRETLERMQRVPPEPAPQVSAAPPPAPLRARTDKEIRKEFLDRAVHRVNSIVPDHPALRLLLMLAVFGAVTLLLFAGSRVADLPKLRLGRSALLAVVTLFFAALGFFAPREVLRPEAIPLVVASEILAWVLIARVLAGGVMSKAVLLLSFFLAAIFLIGSSTFSVLTAL